MRRRWSARSLKYFLLAGKGVANNKHSRCTHVLWLYNDIIEKLDNFKHEWKSGSRATTRTVPVQQTVCTRALAIVPSLSLSFETFESRYDTVNHEMVGKLSVKGIRARVRALSKLAGFYISRRNGSVMSSSFGLFKRSELRCNENTSCLRLSNHFILVRI